MASRWFDDLCDDDFFTRPSRFRLLQTDPWGSLERLDHDLGRSDIFSDFASKAASLRHRVEQDRQSRESPQKKASSRRDSRVSDGIASPTPSSINSAFNFGETPPQPQGHVTFPASSCSNISECSEKSNDSITTEKSANHCSESEKLPGGGQACKAESTQSWVDRNTTGGIVGEGVLTETMKTESRPGSFQEYSKQKCSYVGTGQTPSNTFHSVISEERISQSSSSKSKVKHASPTVVNSAAGIGGKPFRAPPNRSLFYDELDSTLGAGLNRGIRRRTSPLDRLIGLVDQVAHHDRLFQSEMDHFLNDQPKLSTQPATPNTRSDARTKTVEDLKKENEALKEENSRLEQVLQEVTAVNKRWQRYNTDRRMYVQKLLATIQDLQEQMNDRAESAIARPTSTATPARVDSGGVSTSEVDGLRQQAQLLLLQIKSHKEDWQAEHQERCKIMQEKNELEGEVARLKRKLDVLQNEKQCSTCQEASVNQQTHIASQDFSPRSSYETSFQVPFTAEDIHSDASTEIVEDQSSPACEDTFTGWRDSFSTNKTSASDSQSLYLGYPSAGLASVIGFSTMSHPESNQRLNITSESRNAADQAKMNDCVLTFDKLDVGRITNKVTVESCGAVSLFVGTTRDNFEGKKVVHLEYEAYEPMAKKALHALAEEIRVKYGVVNIAIHHRLGTVPVKEASVVIAVSSPHRKESLEAVAFAIDSLKSNVPIFKKEIYAGEEPAWKANPECEDVMEIRTQPLASVPNEHVQVTANVEEVNRRIAAFIKRKRQENDMNNLRDFCFHGARIVERDFSCARVDAVVIRNKNSKSHLKVSRVVNLEGPQLQEQPDDLVPFVPDPGISSSATSNSFSRACPVGAQERLTNAETFLGVLKSSEDVFARLKAIEDRILFLESVSPEYFSSRTTKLCDDKNDGALKNHPQQKVLHLGVKRQRKM